MVQDNFLSQLDDQNHQTKKRSASIHFEDELEKLPELDWQNKKRKHRCIMFTEKDCENTVA